MTTSSDYAAGGHVDRVAEVTSASRSALPTIRRKAGPSKPVPLDLFSPTSAPPSTAPPRTQPSTPSHPTYSTSSVTGELTPPETPSLVVDPEPVTPRKKPPTPGVSPRTPPHRLSFTSPGRLPGEVTDSSSGASPSSSPRGVPARSPGPALRHASIAHPGAATATPSILTELTGIEAAGAGELYSVPNAPLPSTSTSPPLEPRTEPYLQLLCTSNTPIQPGTTFPIALRAFNFLPSSARPLSATLTFLCTSSIHPSSSSDNLSTAPPLHTLFRLSAPLVLDGPLWSGSVTVPTSCRCETCGASLAQVPWTFMHVGGAGETAYETAFRLEAVAGELKAELVVEVLPRPAVPQPEAWHRIASKALKREVPGLEGLELEDVEVSYYFPKHTPAFLDATSDIPLILQASITFCKNRFSSSESVTSLFALLTPPTASFALLAVLAPADGDTPPFLLGGSWTTSTSADEFYLEVDTLSDADLVKVVVRQRMVPKAVVFASSLSCAGFSVGFQLHFRLTSPPFVSLVSNHLHLTIPFLPAPNPSLAPPPRHLRPTQPAPSFLSQDRPSVRYPELGETEWWWVERVRRRWKSIGRAVRSFSCM